jgi:microsomal dipeptidase-like Zn-dependent dipeptidase
VGKPEGKSPLGPRCRWVDNIKMDGVVWTGLIWLRKGAVGDSCEHAEILE